ncbi:hypothetical protein [Bacillus sp. EB01]|nr:hypothetical protein [Bacillus sp. EB01]
MVSLIILCSIIFVSAYYCIEASGQKVEVKSIQTVNDYFIETDGHEQ